MTSRTLQRTALVLLLVAGLAGCDAPVHGPASGGRGGVAAPAPAQAPAGHPSPYGADDRSPGGFAIETDPRNRPQSTFAMDVDTASYGYAGNLLRQGRHPDPQDVRPEEFVNAFRQDYPQPTGDGFTIQADGARLPGTHRVSPAGD